MMQKLSLSQLSRLARLGLPMVSILLVGYMGTILFHTSHAAELPTSQSTNQPTVAAAPVILPPSVTSDCCEIRINSRSQPPGPASLLRLNLTILNRTNHILQISPGLMMNVVDTAGLSHNFTAAALAVGTSVGGPIGVGASSTQDLDFELPVNSTPNFLIFQLDAATQPVRIGLPS